ncbi:hypothetical protein GLOTRDRAFT_30890 [Gloeophyllum trabeum ATCC 11539]|uniref:Uncharacterized protein n=1 Tax=Gloeophyllum trabeum (strain ATCC 11539 / FP-39264 / Madison 617) TaxID=670483 RepID=S7S1Q4_GLOTA|nr:uncharacterized protein GLOTRDRAFT_30890 [Gloeophyllum trabeum ATCC 11539]EPQ61385.1 hypothetical protein GLOTRDRAFT_30890 [Gloeophyllum trabeum ATCC 11539]
MTKTYLMTSLIEKMQSPDQDFRFMGLNDLMTEIKQDPNCLLGDESMENKVIRQVLQLVQDKISEVKNQAVNLGQLIKIIRETQMDFVIDQLIEFSSGKDDELRDISGLALKTITSELPPSGQIAGKACAKLAPRLLQQLSNAQTPPETLMETLSILSILITRFPGHLSSPTLMPQPLTVIPPLLSHPRTAVRKRAIITIAQYAPVSPPELFHELLARDILPFLASGASIDKQTTTVQLVTAIVRHSPTQIIPSLSEIVPGIVAAVQRDDDELRESCLQALETLVLRCPSEMTPFLTAVVQIGSQYIKYDPNYAADDDDDEDEEMVDAEDEEDDAELDEYSDEEDTSYKIRRSATKLLAAIIGTRPEQLVTLYKDVSPVLISRFGDREETVRLEVWATYVSLLNQTRVYGGVAPEKVFDAPSPVGGKRKREEEGMDVEETPYNILRGQVPSLSKALLNQLKSSKTKPPVLQAGFELLQTLLSVLPGCLSSQAAPIASTARSILGQAPTSSSSNLHVTCLSFLSLFFSSHSPPTFSSTLPTLTPVLLKSLGEKHPRVASEAFRVFSSLLYALKPVKGADWAESVYNEALRRLTNHDTDSEVRNCVEECIGDLWICATDVVRGRDRKEWDAICRTSGRTEGAVKVVTKVAREVDVGDDWVNGCMQWVMSLLKRSGRTEKNDLFICLDTLLQRYKTGVPEDLPPVLVGQLKTFVTTTDISALSQALTSIAVLLELSPKITFPVVERDLLKDIYAIAHSPLLAGGALDSLLAFFAALVEADDQIATHVVPSLVISLSKAPKGEASPANVSKCIAQVVQSQQGVAAGVIAEFSKHLKKNSKANTSQVVLSLLILGELGRFIDMSPQHDIFTSTIDFFTAEQEEVRTAAAFAAGNIAVGNLHHFLPSIIKIVKNDPQRRLLALHAVKEVVTHCLHGQLETVADTLWVPLFENSENSEETTRNVAAACLGKLTVTQPSRYLPQLHARIEDENPSTRATVVSAIRYTFSDPSRSYDELLAPVIIDFLSLMHDTDLTVRRLALSALNSAARTKPHLIRDHLDALLPSLYKETVINPDLIRTVQMGPWTHKVDDGLETRKTAYETMYTLLDTCLSKLDLHEFFARVLNGLVDDSDEIKVISHMMLFRLSQLAPTVVAQRLDETAPQLEKTMKGATVTKDTVKQDLERASELQRSALRAVAALSKIRTPGASPRFDALVDELQKSQQWSGEFKELVGA